MQISTMNEDFFRFLMDVKRSLTFNGYVNLKPPVTSKFILKLRKRKCVKIVAVKVKIVNLSI